MSVAETGSAAAGLSEAPEFGLECLFDDADDPREVTIFDPDPSRLTTEWITADHEAAVVLDQVR